MKKSLVALSVAAISTAALAQSNVTIYGVADVSVQGQNISKGTARDGGPQGGDAKVVSNNSLIGFKGTEDLGNGNKALFQIETRVNLNGTGSGNSAYNNGNAFSTMRESFVGLQNDKAGKVQAGYLNSPYKRVLLAYDVFPGAAGDPYIGSVFGRTVAGAGSNASAVGQYAMNQSAYYYSTGMNYVTPTIYGVTGTVSYTGSGNNNNTNNQTNSTAVTGAVTPNSATGVSLGWTGYGVRVDGAIQQASYTNAGNLNVTPLATSTNYLVGASYTGVPGLKVGALYGRNSFGMNSTSDTGAEKGASNSVWLGASYRFGNNEPRISYANTSNTSGLSGTNPTFGSQNGANQYSLGWGYYLSKRTQVYGVVAQIKNNANGVYNFANYTGGTTNNLTGGEKLTTYGVGLRTNF